MVMVTSKKSRWVAAAGAASALMLLAACGSSSDGKTDAKGGTTTVKVMMFPGQAYRLLPDVAEKEGYFKDRGIKMEVVDQPPTLQGIQGLYATKAQVGQVTVGTLGQGVQGGNDAKFFCGGINVLQTTLIAPTDSKLPSTDDGASWQDVLKGLDGKKIGIQTPVGSGLQLIFAAALKEAGVENVTYVNLGGSPTGTIAALQNKSVDVAQANPPTTQFFAQEGKAKPLLYMADGPTVYKDYYGSGWVAPTKWLDDNPDVAKAFCGAMADAIKYIQDPANAQAAADIFVADAKVTPEVAKTVVDQVYGDFSTKLDKDTLTKTFDAYEKLGIFKAEPKMDYDALVDDQNE
jgi:ABC-type nitrate/sulfonate/bicarbonate transport system substrate-binding protein